MRALAKLLLGAVLLASLASAALAIALRMPAVRGEIAHQLGAALSDDHRTVTISSLGGALPFRPTVGVLEISDRGGPWLRIENLTLDIDPMPLLLRHLHVRDATAERVVVWKLPQPDEEPFVWKPMRLLVTAKRIAVRAIDLGRELLHAGTGPEVGAPIAAEAKGWADLRRLTLAMELSATSERLDDVLRAIGGDTPISTSTARLVVKARGAIEAPSGSAELVVSGVRRGSLFAETIELDATAERLGRGERRYRVTFGAHTSGVEGPEKLSAWLGRSPGLQAVARFGARPDVFDVDALKVETATFGAEMTGHVDETGRVDIPQLSVTLPDLHSAPGLEELVRGGALRLRMGGSVSSAWTAPSVEATLSTAGVDLDFADARLALLLDATPKLDATLRYDAEAGLEASAIRFIGGELKITGKGSLAPSGAIYAAGDLEVKEIAGLDTTTPSRISGAVVGTMELSGTPDAFEATATARPRGLRLRGGNPLAGDIVVSARGNLESVTGDVSARLTYGNHPIQAATRYRYETDRAEARLDALTASLPGIDIDGAATVSVSPFLARGHAGVRGRDLSALAAIFGIDAGGAVDASFDFDHDGVRQRTRVSAVGHDLHFDDLSVEAVRLDVTPVVSGTASRFEMNANGAYRHDFSFHAAGELRGSLSASDITFDRLDGTYAERPFSSRRALRVLVRDGGVTVGDASVDVAGGNIEGSWGEGGLRGTGRLRFSHMPLSLLSLISAHAVAVGEVSGEMSRATLRDDLEVTARTSNAGIASASAPGGVSRFELDASAHLSARRTRVDSAVATPDGALRFELTMDLPVGIDGEDAGGGLNGRVAGALSAEWLGQLVLPEDDQIAGRLDVAFDLGGTLESPTAIGSATGNLRYSSALTGMNLRIEDLDLRAEGQRLRVAAFRGNDGRQGVIEGRGTVDFSDGFDQAVYDVEIAFLDTYLARIDEVRLRGDGALQLTGRGSAAVLKGGFTADEAILRVPERLPPEVATIPVEHVNLEMSRNPPPVAGESAPAVPIGLDLALQFPTYLRVEDPNLDSEWRGDLFIRGDTVTPDVQGKLTVIRGRFALGGVQFIASEGSLSFDEESDIPTVDITAVANRNQIEATLRLHGRVDRAEIELRSEPPLPQDEILSRLMFGATTATLTPAQSVQLAQAAARLSGTGMGIDVLGRMRRLVGVDRIEIKDTTDTTTGETTTAVSVGKYLTNRIYVSLEQAVGEQGSKARVEVELTKHIAAETEVGQDQNALVGLKWRWNY